MMIKLQAINIDTLSEDVLAKMAYGYTFDQSTCGFTNVCSNAIDFLQQYDNLVMNMLNQLGVGQYIAGNVRAFWDPDHYQLDNNDDAFCNAIACTFRIFGHDVFLYPCVTGYEKDPRELKLDLDVLIPDHDTYCLSVNDAIGVIKYLISDDVAVTKKDINSSGKFVAMVDSVYVKHETDKAIKFYMPSNSNYDDWFYWWPKNNLTETKLENGNKAYILKPIPNYDHVRLERQQKQYNFKAKDYYNMPIKQFQSEVSTEELPF